MFVYRISKTKYASDLSGEGARLNGGRWNHILTACIYTSQNRALALLEFTVNTNINFIPRALSITTLEISDTNIVSLTEANLPGNWKETPAPSSTKDFGTRFLKAAAAPIIKIPSVVMPDEFNYLLNPAHPEASLFKVVEVKDFVYDVRIKLT